MITAEDVTEWSREEPSGNLNKVVEATNAYVKALPIMRGQDSMPPGVKLGAIMLASRLIRRRNSLTGTESAIDVGVSYIARTDADISRLLGLDKSMMKPIVG